MGVDFPAGEGTGTLTVAGTKERSAGGFGNGANESAGALDTGIVAALTEALTFAGEVNLGLGDIGRIGAVLAITDDLGVVGVGEGSVEVVFLGTASAIESEGIRILGFGVTGDLVQVWLKVGAVAVIQSAGGRITFMLAVVVLKGDFEIVDISFADSVEGFFELKTVAEETADE